MKTSVNSRRISGMIFVFILCAGMVGTAQARANPVPLATIQEMINAAPDDGTVNIPAGTFNETLLVDKSLTLKGISSTATILHPATSTQRVIKVTAGHNLRLETLRVTGGNPTASGDTAGGGVYLDSGNLVMDHVEIDSNQGSYGGGIFQQSSTNSVIVTDSTIDNNTASITGGGIYSAGSASLTNTNLQNNSAANHGGGMHVGSGTATLNAGTVSGNHALNGNGGGVNVNDGLTVTGTAFSGNSAAGNSSITGSGGAISQWNSLKTVVINGATFTGNTAQVNGGAVFIHLSYLTLGSSTFSDNSVDSGATGTNTEGGGLYAGGGLSGLYLYFSGNYAHCTGCAWSAGGGIFIDGPASSASTVTGATFSTNVAWQGSGIGSTSNVQLTLSYCEFTNNGSLVQGQPLSGYGGGVDGSWVHGDHLTFQNNQALNNGGGISANYIQLTNSRFIGNSVSGQGEGGGVFSYATFAGTNLLFVSNSSDYRGSALYLSSGSSTLYYATISRPTRGPVSAIFVDTNATLELKNSIVSAYNTGLGVSGTVTEDYNLLYNNGVDYDPAGGTINYGIHDVALKDPLFANPALSDYHLRWPSPAIGKGTNLGVTTDLDGKLRLGRYDIGAYQFWTSVFVPVIRK